MDIVEAVLIWLLGTSLTFLVSVAFPDFYSTVAKKCNRIIASVIKPSKPKIEFHQSLSIDMPIEYEMANGTITKGEWSRNEFVSKNERLMVLKQRPDVENVILFNNAEDDETLVSSVMIHSRSTKNVGIRRDVININAAGRDIRELFLRSLGSKVKLEKCQFHMVFSRRPETKFFLSKVKLDFAYGLNAEKDYKIMIHEDSIDFEGVFTDESIDEIISLSRLA